MAWFPIVATVASSVIGYMGNQKAAGAAQQAGQSQQAADKFQADQMNVQAGQEIAASERSAQDQTRQAQLVASRAVAIAGASGGGVSDPTVQNLIGDIQGEGAYRASMKIYQGEDAARNLQMGAAGKTYEGELAVNNADAKADAYRTKAYGSLFGGAGSLYGKYGMGGPAGGGSGSALTGNGWQDAGTDAGAFA